MLAKEYVIAAKAFIVSSPSRGTSGGRIVDSPQSAAVGFPSLLTPGGIAFALVLLGGIAGLLLLLAGRAGWARRKSAGRLRPVGAADGDRGRDPLLPSVRSFLFGPSHHEILHDPDYLERILTAELEGDGAVDSGSAGESAAQSAPSPQASGGPDEGRSDSGEAGRF